MSDLILSIDDRLGRRVGLESALRAAIRSGRLPPGAKMPSTRSLSLDQGLARATVVEAYEQLAIEGYLISRQGSGTVVADIERPVPAPEAETPESRQSYIADFRPGEPDSASFPRAAWLRSVKTAVNQSTDEAFQYGQPLGRSELRNALVEYLGRTRAVYATADSISIFGGVTSAFGFLGELLIRRGVSTVAIEDPSHMWLREVLQLVGVTLLPVPVDNEGINVAALDRLNVGAVITTPAHQYPLGITMSAKRRAELLSWAQAGDRLIIEDDYDGHFRYDRNPIGSIQGLDPDRVIYAGTASKSLSPALRLAWLVVPERLRADLAAVKHLRSGVSAIDQIALADFMQRGELDRQIRTMRSTYNSRRLALAEHVTPVAPWLQLSTPMAGLHLTATATDPSIDTRRIRRMAADRSVGLLELKPHWLGTEEQRGFVLGYSRPPDHQFSHALDCLVDFLSSVEID